MAKRLAGLIFINEKAAVEMIKLMLPRHAQPDLLPLFLFFPL